MHILVTGGLGFIGHHTCMELLRCGHSVTIIDDMREDAVVGLGYKRARMRELSAVERQLGQSLNYIIADCCSIEQQGIHEVDYVIHLAAIPTVRVSHPTQWAMDYVKDNEASFVAVMCWAAERKIPVMYASSSSVYGDVDGDVAEHRQYGVPRSMYALTKQSNERWAELLWRDHPVIGLRIFTVFGKYSRHDMAAARWCLNGVQSVPVEVYKTEDGTPCSRDMVPVSFLAQVIQRLLEVPTGENHRVLNIGHSVLDMGEVAQELMRPINSQHLITDAPLPPEDPVSTYSSTLQLRSMLGDDFPPTLDCQEELRQYAEWYYSHHTMEGHYCVQ